MKNLITSFTTVFTLLMSLTSFAQPDSLFWKPIENSECLFWDRDTLTSISFSWDGDCKNGFIHGEGKLEIKRSDSLEEWYAGSVEKGRFNGFGIYKGITDYYEGYFKNGKPNGTGINYSYSDSTKYEGEWKNGKAHGYLVMTKKNGAIYEGEWENGEKSGVGKFIYDDGSVYKGEFKNDKRHGKGVYKYSDGNKYEGEFFGGKIHGKGEYYFADGTYYNGEFKDDKAHGEGEIYYPSGFRYIGEFKNHKPYNGVVLDNEGYIYMKITEGKEKKVLGKEKWEEN